MITNYTEQGIPVNVIGQTDEGKLIVQHINTAYDGDGDEYETDGQIEVYSGKLFTDRPKPSDNGLIAALSKTREELNADIATLRKEKASLVKEKEAMAIKLESINPTVNRVLKFVEGKFTHAVRISYDGPEIIEATDKRLLGEGCREEGFRLMTLFGNSKGDLSFKINDYRDGSGSWIRIELFESREEAQVFVEKWCADYFSEFDPAQPHGLGYILDKCQQHGVAVPAAINAFDRNQKLEAAKKQAAEAENNLQKHRALIAELEPA